MKFLLLICNFFAFSQAFLKFGDEELKNLNFKRSMDQRKFDEINAEHFRVSYNARPFRKSDLYLSCFSNNLSRRHSPEIRDADSPSTNTPFEAGQLLQQILSMKLFDPEREKTQQELLYLCIFCKALIIYCKTLILNMIFCSIIPVFF